MKNGIILAAFMAALCTSAETVKTATQPWVRSYVATNHTDITGKADATNVYTKAETDAKIVELAPAPGNYATVSNRAMMAIQSHQSLWPAVEASTNYTDAALAEFAATGTVARARSYGTPTRWTDATGRVWETSRRWVISPETYTGSSEWWYGKPIVLAETHEAGEWWRPTCLGDSIGSGKGDEDSTSLSWNEGEAYIDITASRILVTNLVGRVALTNDIPDVTAAIREQSLGGIWDQELGVWWTPIMENGALSYVAATNVNLSAEGN